MVPREEFEAVVSGTARPASEAAEPHAYALARLRHEQNLRQALGDECRVLEAKLVAAEQRANSTSAFLLGLPDRVRALGASSVPLQNYLGPADAAIAAAVARGDSLPHPLLVAWRSLTAAAAADGEGIHIGVADAKLAKLSLSPDEAAEWKDVISPPATGDAAASLAKRQRNPSSSVSPASCGAADVASLFNTHTQVIEISILHDSSAAHSLRATVRLSLLHELGIIAARASLEGEHSAALMAAAAGDETALSLAVLDGMGGRKDDGRRVPVLAMHFADAPASASAATDEVGGITACLVQAAARGASGLRIPSAVHRAHGGAYVWAAAIAGAICLPQEQGGRAANTFFARGLIKHVRDRLRILASLAIGSSTAAGFAAASVKAYAAVTVPQQAHGNVQAPPLIVSCKLAIGAQAIVDEIGKVDASAIAAAIAPQPRRVIARVAEGVGYEENPGADDDLSLLWDEEHPPTASSSFVASSKRPRFVSGISTSNNLDGTLMLHAQLDNGPRFAACVAPFATSDSGGTAFMVCGSSATSSSSMTAPSLLRQAELAGSSTIRSAIGVDTADQALLAGVEAARSVLAV